MVPKASDRVSLGSCTACWPGDPFAKFHILLDVGPFVPAHLTLVRRDSSEARNSLEGDCTCQYISSGP